jgi:hypothetical protein
VWWARYALSPLIYAAYMPSRLYSRYVLRRLCAEPLIVSCLYTEPLIVSRSIRGNPRSQRSGAIPFHFS